MDNGNGGTSPLLLWLSNGCRIVVFNLLAMWGWSKGQIGLHARTGPQLASVCPMCFHLDPHGYIWGPWGPVPPTSSPAYGDQGPRAPRHPCPVPHTRVRVPCHNPQGSPQTCWETCRLNGTVPGVGSGPYAGG